MSALLPCPKTWSEWRVWLLGFENRVRPLTRYEEVSAHVDAAAAQLDAWNRRAPPPLPTREALIAAIAPVWDRMTQPGQVKLSDLCGDAADAVLRLLGGEMGA